MKKISLLLIVLMLALSFAFTGCEIEKEVFDYTFVGEGTAASPYLVATKEDLQHIHYKEVNQAGVYFKQTANIDLGAANDKGRNFNSVSKLLANYDGDGYSISTLVYKSASFGGVFALFSTVDGATVKNINLTADIEVSGLVVHAAGIAGTLKNGAVISNCGVSGSITAVGMSATAAGIAADAAGGSIEKCFNTSTVTAVVFADSSLDSGAQAAGIAVTANSVQNCYNAGIITAVLNRELTEGEVSPALSTAGLVCTVGSVLSGYYLDNAANGYLTLTEGASASAVSKSDAEMKAQAFVDTLNGGSSVWIKTEGYPSLSVFK